AIIGGGPVGCLAALGLAERGFQVTMYESRSEAEAQAPSLRSINLAISTRGLAGLSSVSESLASDVLARAVPMRGRMIHSQRGDQQSQRYGAEGECIHSVDRARLNRLLLERAQKHARVEVVYGHKLRALDLDAQPAQLTFAGAHGARAADLVVGCDGMHSAVRDSVARATTLDFAREYIDSLYVELSMPAAKPGQASLEGGFVIDPHHLHIWPRHSFMLIALPNPDKTFTCTLFAPADIFEHHLSDPTSTIAFFEQHFADALPLIGRQAIVKDILSRKPSPLASVKAKPYHYADKAIFIGDAAHAMLPFYGQGLNCGFEDVRVLLQLIDKHSSRQRNGADYSNTRHDDLVAICELAKNNYKEMSSKVISRTYLLRKALDTVLMSILPRSIWSSLYSMVTFSNLPYSQARDRERRQAKVV
ncbi:FAD/NAD(P)-binding domain-containing protein, partial [Ceraceosorus guamensis]